MRFCSSCGSPVPAGKSFCTVCGGRLAPPDAQTAATPVVRSADQVATGSRRHHWWSRWLLAALVAVLAAVGGTAFALVATGRTPTSHDAISGSKTRVPATWSALGQNVTPPATAPSASTSPAAPSDTHTPEQVGAQGLSHLLAASAADRIAIVAAVGDVNACVKVPQDLQTFQQDARSRDQLLIQLDALPDSSALPAQMLQDLAGAWKASYQADEDFGAWAEDQSQVCTPNDSSDLNFQAAATPDHLATSDKQAFVILWDPIAETYRLTSYQWDKL
jgi:hypothetical protein